MNFITKLHMELLFSNFSLKNLNVETIDGKNLGVTLRDLHQTSSM